MYKGDRARFLPVVIVLIIIVVAVIGLVSAGRAIFGGNTNTQPQQTDVSRDALLSTGIDRSVRMTVRGALVADEKFRSYQITVTPTSRSLTTYSGYLEQQLGSQQLSNNVKAYEELVYALEKANLAKGEAFTGEKDDTRGICAAGTVYEFEIMNGTTVIKRLWTSTCKGSPGSLKASVEQVKNLFLVQIPDRKALLDPLRLQ